MSFAEGYVDVATRIAEFREQFPFGSLRPADPANPYRIETTADGQQWIVVVAVAYRSDADPIPGIGMAWEQYPGRTPYTRGSELQNAETSAWGRAIVAALAADTKRGVASADEVRNRAAERTPDTGMTDAAYQALVDGLPEQTDLDILRSIFVEAKRRGDETVMGESKARAEAVKA
jgi:hypothetical protein